MARHQRTHLVGRDIGDRAARKASCDKTGVLFLFRMPTLLVLCAINFLSNIGIQGFFLWLPTTVRRAS
jgi:hypothetical protein